MSIYQEHDFEKALESVHSEEALKKLLVEAFELSKSNDFRSRLYALVTTGSDKGLRSVDCKLTSTRSISHKKMIHLEQSPVLLYTKEIITAALDPRGPFQSKEILLMAHGIAIDKGFKKPSLFKPLGIPPEFLNQIGYVLSLAGFERKSAYDKERKMPIKAWKPARGFKTLSIEQHVTIVEQRIHEILSGQEQAPIPPIKNNTLMENFL